MTRRAIVAAATLVLMAVIVVLVSATSRPTVELRPGADVERAAASLPQGTIRLLPGVYGPFALHTPVRIEGEDGVVVRGPITIAADHVTLRGLEVRGGENGVTVDRVDHVTLEDLTIAGATLHGIEVSSGSAIVRDCRIIGLRSPFAQGFEIRNSNGHPRSVVEGCVVHGGQEGIVSHVSRVEFRDNIVRGSTLRGIAVTEMSEGLVEGNLVEDAVGTAYYCGDMSHCEIRRNSGRRIAPDPDPIKSQAGYGVVAYYYSTMRVDENRFHALAADPVGVFSGSITVDRFPLSVWPAGWRGAVPGLAWAAGALALLAIVRLAVGPWARRERPPSRLRDPQLALYALAAAFAVQTFHMLEHGVQVVQVYVIESQNQRGLAGALADTEWVHFMYNLAVLAFLVWIWRLVRPGGALAGSVGKGAGFLLAALVVQSYHMAEHTAKLIQHLSTGIDPAPGIIGGAAGLVWFHFAINLTVYVGMAIPVVSVLRSWLDSRGLVAEPGR